MKETVCWQYVIRDNQVMGVDTYLLTKGHYASKRECEKVWGKEKTEYCFTVIKAFRPSRQTGEMARHLIDSTIACRERERIRRDHERVQAEFDRERRMAWGKRGKIARWLKRRFG